MPSFRFGARALAATLSLGIAATAQSTQTLPRGFDTTEGSSSTGFPFSQTATHKWHWVYDSAQFVANYPILIRQIDIRPDGSVASWGPQTYQNFEMRLGASQNHYAVGSYNATFDANWAPGTGSPHAFFQGALNVPAGTRPGTGGPNAWSISVTGAPFLYDPTSGNDFIVELRTPGTGPGTNPVLHATDGQTGAANANGGNRYGDTANASATNWTFSNNEFVPIVQIHYTPASGLYAGFSATPSSGPTPLNVTFTDTSFSSAPGGISSWAWDLDGDGIVDSNAASPSFSYATCGRYDVTLTVTDGVNPASTITRTDFITADPQLLVNASFSWVPGPLPNSIQFTDTSTGSPSVWSWDFDGDNVPDSAQQNPLWAYATGGSFNVSFTASNACGGGTASGTVFVIANDECTGAIPLQLGLSPVYSNTNATTSQAWPCAGGGSDLWYSYRSTCNGTLEVNTCTGTSYDSALEAFSGSCGSLTPILCNDDSCGLQSRISFAVLPATTYFIRVGGYSSAQGSFQLNLTLSSTGTGSFATQFPACGGANLATTGAPNLGAAIGFTMTPATGATFFMVGSVPLGVPLCPQGCIIGHNMDVVLPGPTFQATVPCWSFLRGGQVYFQGLELGTAGGCTSGNPLQLVTTQTIVATIG
ncbi:MAG: PKD domain-containing protein [Planctomycetes bacterium]|nr:PKD domain-containing protein [Planctomycetota bacterium]